MVAQSEEGHHGVEASCYREAENAVVEGLGAPDVADFQDGVTELLDSHSSTPDWLRQQCGTAQGWLAVAGSVVSGTMPASDELMVRRAALEDAEAIGQLLYDFNCEYDQPTPAPPVLAARVRQLLESGDTVVLLAGNGPEGLAVLRFRLAIWSSGLECYLAELYVVPAQRGHGLGRALMEAALREARERGADTMDLGTDETDIVARRLYESLGFTNREDSGTGPVMYVYEREL
jgi:ribosomal protein S18 acetylase RimI-like enzyme